MLLGNRCLSLPNVPMLGVERTPSRAVVEEENFNLRQRLQALRNDVRDAESLITEARQATTVAREAALRSEQQCADHYRDTQILEEQLAQVQQAERRRQQQQLSPEASSAGWLSQDSEVRRLTQSYSIAVEEEREVANAVDCASEELGRAQLHIADLRERLAQAHAELRLEDAQLKSLEGVCQREEADSEAAEIEACAARADLEKRAEAAEDQARLTEELGRLAALRISQELERRNDEWRTEERLQMRLHAEVAEVQAAGVQICGHYRLQLVRADEASTYWLKRACAAESEEEKHLAKKMEVQNQYSFSDAIFHAQDRAFMVASLWAWSRALSISRSESVIGQKTNDAATNETHRLNAFSRAWSAQFAVRLCLAQARVLLSWRGLTRNSFADRCRDAAKVGMPVLQQRSRGTLKPWLLSKCAMEDSMLLMSELNEWYRYVIHPRHKDKSVRLKDRLGAMTERLSSMAEFSFVARQRFIDSRTLCDAFLMWESGTKRETQIRRLQVVREELLILKLKCMDSIRNITVSSLFGHEPGLFKKRAFHMWKQVVEETVRAANVTGVEEQVLKLQTAAAPTANLALLTLLGDDNNVLIKRVFGTWKELVPELKNERKTDENIKMLEDAVQDQRKMAENLFQEAATTKKQLEEARHNLSGNTKDAQRVEQTIQTLEQKHKKQKAKAAEAQKVVEQKSQKRSELEEKKRRQSEFVASNLQRRSTATLGKMAAAQNLIPDAEPKPMSRNSLQKLKDIVEEVKLVRTQNEQLMALVGRLSATVERLRSDAEPIQARAERSEKALHELQMEHGKLLGELRKSLEVSRRNTNMLGIPEPFLASSPHEVRVKAEPESDSDSNSD